MMMNMRLLDKKFNIVGQLSLPAEICMIIKRFKKQYASLHSQDKKLFVFANTPLNQLSLPVGLSVSKNLTDFKVKIVKGGFQRRPELIVNNDSISLQNSSQTWDQVVHLEKIDPRHDKNKRIQRELVEKAISLIHDIELTKNSDRFLGNIRKDEKDTLILDIGCGDGSSSFPLLDMGYSCVGVDLNLRGLSEFQISYNKWSKPCHSAAAMHRGVLGMSLQSPNLDFHLNTNIKEQQTGENTEFGSYNNLVPVISNTKYGSSRCMDIVRWDLRHGLPFRAGTFDLAISISFLQWLFYGNRQRQLHLFFSSLKSVLMPLGKAVIQFYPTNTGQLAEAVHCAERYFQGVLVGDYPHIDRGRKLFLVLFNDLRQGEIETEFDDVLLDMREKQLYGNIV